MCILIILTFTWISPLSDGWSSPVLTGQAPPPCYWFSLTTVGGKRAAMFGGSTPSSLCSDDLYIVDLERHSVVSVCRHCMNSIALICGSTLV